MDQTHIDILNEERLVPLMPEFVDRIRQMIAELEQDMDPILITQGLRTFAQQTALFAQGRQGLAEVNALRLAVNWAPLALANNQHTVTNAQAGFGFHNYGVAIDVVPITQVGQPDWNDSHPDWQTCIQVANKYGLEHGDRGFHDNPHFQLIGDLSIPIPQRLKPEALKAVYKPNDLSACWDLVRSKL